MLAVLRETVLRKNRASSTGGAIFTNNFDAIRVSCSQDSGSQWRSTHIIRSEEDVCDNWKQNTARAYGQTVGSPAVQMRKVIQSESGSEMVVAENHYVVQNYASGTPLPTIILQSFDDLGQISAAGLASSTVRATMSSPDGFFRGSMTISLEGGRGSFTDIVGFQPPGNYALHISFSEEYLEDFVVQVEVRNCRIGEVVAANGSFCQPCNSGSYNFSPEEESTCLQCPEDAVCDSSFIRPKKGFWHQFPCSNQLQRCLTDRACDFAERDQNLTSITMEASGCAFDGKFITEYSSAQCSKAIPTLLALVADTSCLGTQRASLWVMR